MQATDAIWVEKYRPTTLDDLIGQDEIVSLLTEFAGDAEMPNILLAGRQGIGKTAMTVALAREIYGDRWQSNMLELNASDDRGIDTVRDRIKSFARTDTLGDFPFKLIFLDEVDNTTKDAQSAMRRVMEDFSDKTRFILSCNYPNRIIPPIQSRCAVYRLKPLTDDDIRRIIQRVIDGEGLSVADDALDRLVDIASGDARRAINTLQGATLADEVTADGVEAVAPMLSFDTVREIIDLAVGGDLSGAQRKLDVEVLKKGVGAQQFLDEAFSAIQYAEMPEDARAKSMEQVAEVDYRLLQGANPHVQLHALLARIHVARHLSLPNYDDS